MWFWCGSNHPPRLTVHAHVAGPPVGSGGGAGQAGVHPRRAGDSGGDVLCIGIDVAWWGGQAGNSETRSECITYAVRQGGKWGDLNVRRVDLTIADVEKARDTEPNADPDAALLVEALKGVLAEHQNVPHVILALDVPLKAKDHKLPDRKKSKKQKGGNKELEYRLCEDAWIAEQRKSPDGWRNVEVMPGAPLFPRIVQLVRHLTGLGFAMYRHPWTDSPRLTLVECFPNEVIWSAGVLGFAGNLTAASLRAYKRLGKLRQIAGGRVR